MVKVKVKQDISNKPKFILMILGFTMVMVFFFFGTDKISNLFYSFKKESDISSQTEIIENSDNKGTQEKSILSKEDHLKTYDDWKKIADYRTEEFYTCHKQFIDEDKWMQAVDICGAEHRNNYVLFRDGIDERSNLNYEDRQSLLKYWDEQFDITIKKIRKLIDENEMKKRPNRVD